MARGVTLGELVAKLRRTAGRSADPAQGKNELGHLIELLQRTQETLWLEHDWPFLRIQRDIPLQAGLRFYDFPVAYEQVRRVSTRWGQEWLELDRGIAEAQYAELESDETPAVGSFVVTGGTPAAAVGSFLVSGGTAGAGNQITQITVDGRGLLTAPVAWVTSNAATATAVAAAINANVTSPKYTARAVGTTVTITADPDLGNLANSFVLAVVVGGNVSVSSITGMAGGAHNFVHQVKVDGLDILGDNPHPYSPPQNPGRVGWRGSNAETATAIAARINASTTVPNYTAQAFANQVRIYSTPTHISGNGLEVAVTVNGTVTVGSIVNMANGVVSDRSDPAMRWDVRRNNGREQLEIWPVPASNQSVLRFTAVEQLAPLVADNDICTLDANLIVLTAAADLIKDKKLAADKLRQAGALFARLKARTTGSRTPASFVGQQHAPRRGGPVRVAYVRNP